MPVKFNSSRHGDKNYIVSLIYNNVMRTIRLDPVWCHYLSVIPSILLLLSKPLQIILVVSINIHGPFYGIYIIIVSTFVKI